MRKKIENQLNFYNNRSNRKKQNIIFITTENQKHHTHTQRERDRKQQNKTKQKRHSEKSERKENPYIILFYEKEK